MARNLFIIVISAFVISLVVYMLKNRKTIGTTKKKLALIFFALWFFAIGLPNASVLFAPLTPTINLAVVDSTTNQPLRYCNFKAYWILESITPAGGQRESYYNINAQTDEYGKFKIQRHQKALSLRGTFPVLESHFSGMKIVAYDHGYRYESRDIGHAYHNLVDLNLDLKKIDDPKEYLENIFSLYLNVFIKDKNNKEMREEDRKFIIDEFKRFRLLFADLPLKKELYENFLQLAGIFEQLGAYQEEIEIFSVIESNFPEKTSMAKQEIQRLKLLN